MTAQEKDRIECAIRHIKTATDIDPWAMELAVDALEKQLSNHSEIPNSSDDLISRQDAIDVVNEGCQEWRGIFERCKEKLWSLPSAQPEQPIYEVLTAEEVTTEVCTVSLLSWMEWFDVFRKVYGMGYVICRKPE